MVTLEILGGSEACFVCGKDEGRLVAMCTEELDSAGAPVMLAVHAPCLRKIAGQAAKV